MNDEAVTENRQVWISRSRRGAKGTYHLFVDCPKHGENMREVSLLSLRGQYDLCKVCKSRSDEYEFEIENPAFGGEMACPRCGDKTETLGHHIRHCDGGDET